MLALQFKAASTSLPYEIHFHALEGEGMLINTDKFKVSCFATRHRIPCWGFRFDQVRAPRRVNPAKCVQEAVPTSFYDRLKWGEDYHGPDGKIVRNDQVTELAPKAKSYAYSADTIFDESLIEKLQGVDMLYHETTYLKDLAERAASRFHSTTVQAACIAKRAKVGRLLIGHFSSKYEKLDIFQQEATTVYPNTDLAIEGVTYTA